MERPERPSRHKSNPNRFPMRPTFSSDSESEPNENDVPIQITFYQAESSNGNAGPSTSSNPQPGPATGVDNSTNRLDSRLLGSPRSPPGAPLRLSMSPSPVAPTTPEEEDGAEAPLQEAVRRKRSAASSAASVIFDSVDTLIASNSSMSVQICDNRSSTSPERFPPGKYVLRPKSFCHMPNWGNAIRPSSYKMKRFNAPMDLTPNTSSRESSAQRPVVTSSFSLQDNATLPAPSESAHSTFYSRNTVPPYVIPPRNNQSGSSSILRQFDEICSTSSTPVIRRKKFVRFLEGTRFPDGPSSEQTSSSPLSNRTSTLDDYCDLVGNFLFNYPSSTQTTENQSRSPPVAVPLERTTVPEIQASSMADIISRHALCTVAVPLERTTVPEPQTSSAADVIDRHAHSIISEINSYLDPPQSQRSTIDGGEPMEQSNDDVIVVETPERPIASSPEYIVPSSRSPSPAPALPPQAPLLPTPSPNTAANSATIASPPPRQDKPQSSGSDVPMTLPELNLSLVALLECPVCLDHATPPIYQCIKGHILCQSCHPRLTSCPMCRSRLPGDRNSVMEKVAEKLMYPCKNTVTGCTMMLKLGDKQAHEEGCGFRHYACIVSSCSWKGYKPELVVHLQSDHPDKLITGATKELHVPISGIIGGSGFVVHHWILSAHNEVFHVVFNVDTFKRIMKGCVIYVGSRDKAEKFEYLFQLKQRVSPFRKLSYSRTTHVDTLKQGQPLCLRDDFSINIDMAQLYRPADCCHQIIPIFITINQLE